MRTIGTTVRNTVGALALLTMIPAAGWAFGGPWGPCGDGFGPRGGGRGMGMGIGQDNSPMTQALNLTAEQKTKIQGILDEERKKTEPIRKELWETRGQVWEAANKDAVRRSGDPEAGGRTGEKAHRAVRVQGRRHEPGQSGADPRAAGTG